MFYLHLKFSNNDSKDIQGNLVPFNAGRFGEFVVRVCQLARICNNAGRRCGFSSG
jgi:hypothetical protein